MSKIVFILGAGASKQAGAPLMGDFLDSASKLLVMGETGDKQKDFERVFSAIGSLQKVHSKSQLDLSNIESVFNAFEMANILGKMPDINPEDIPQVIESLKELIVKTLERTVKFAVPEMQIEAPSPYKEFAELVYFLGQTSKPAYSVSIMTFNYDVSVDVAFYRYGLGINYGIDSNNSSKTEIPLLKLHGSMNWGFDENKEVIIPVPISSIIDNYGIPNLGGRRYCTVDVARKMKMYFINKADLKISPVPVIVPPTWNKVDHFKGLASIWAKAAAELGEAEYIFIIGYSMPETDAFFRYLYALGSVGDNPLKQITVYNPDDTGQIKGRYKDMLGPGAIGRFNYVPKKFNEAIPEIKRIFL